MGLFEGCLMASDIDGTLIEKGYINPENLKWISYFMSEGGYFSLSTGRSVGAISDVVKQLEKFSPSVVANGCMIYDYSDNKILYQDFIPRSDHSFAEFIVKNGNNAGAEIHCGEEAFTLNRTEKTTNHQKYEKFEAPDKSFEFIDKFDWNKVIFTFDNEQDRNKMFDLVKEMPSSSDFIKTAANLTGEYDYYLEIVPKNVSKASAIKKLCEILDVKSGKLFAIGDYYNDVEMLNLADISAVVEDAPEELKEISDYVTCKCKDGAVADFIKNLKNMYENKA